MSAASSWRRRERRRAVAQQLPLSRHVRAARLCAGRGRCARHRRLLRHARFLPQPARARRLQARSPTGSWPSRGATARIGATGISYLGAACDFLASTGHTAVKAIAPLFAVWDTWADNYYPGGMLIKRLALVYDELMLALDHDRRDLRKQFTYFADPALLGPMPVDDDQRRLARARGGEGPSREFPHARLHHRVQIPRRRAALRSVLHQRLVQPLQLSRRDAAGRRGLCRLRLDGRRGLRQRHAVALPHPAQRPSAVSCWARGTTARGSTPRRGARGSGARAPGAGRGAALLRPASRRPRHRARATRTRSTTSPSMPRNGARPRAGRR